MVPTPQLALLHSDTPERALAWAVLMQAFKDAKEAKRDEDRVRAALFLTRPNEDLEFWCAVAGTSPERIVAYSNHQLLRGPTGVLRSHHRKRDTLSVREP